MTAVKVDLPIVNSVKSGSTTVNRIMCGENKIWPTFPIVMFRDGEYYNVTGIQNNEYVTNSVSGTRCYLATVYSSFSTGIQQQNWMSVEACISSFKDAHVAMTVGGGDSNKDFECFQNGSTLYFDYMANSSNGSNFNRLNISVSGSPYNQIYDTTNLNNKWVLEYTTNETELKKYIKIRRFGETEYLKTASKTCYIPTVLNTNVIRVPNPDRNKIVNMYYVKIFDRNKNLISFCHLKDNNGQVAMYDEVQKKFLDFITDRPTTGNVIYDDKYVDVIPAISDYYEVSGTITSDGHTYERLINNKTGVIIKGVEIL